VPAIIAGIVGRALAPRTATLAIFRGAHGEPLDQGIALYFPAPHSYTGEAGARAARSRRPAVLRAAARALPRSRARARAPGEFTERAFLNDKLDLAQAESVADLIEPAPRPRRAPRRAA
jgi:tRNA modification GTPase